MRNAPTLAPGATYNGPVTEIAIRLLSETQDPAEFSAARDAFVALLTSQPGVGTDREFAAVIDGATFGPPARPVFTGMTHSGWYSARSASVTVRSSRMDMPAMQAGLRGIRWMPGTSRTATISSSHKPYRVPSIDRISSCLI